MMLMYTIVLFFSAIILIFSQEFLRIFQKLIAIPGVRLLVPLMLASWLIESYQDWGNWILLWLRAKYHEGIQSLSSLLPYETGSVHTIRIMTLVILACFPIFVFWFKTKRQGGYYSPYKSYYVGAIFWIFAVFLLLIQPQ